jgi:hypothetical protein
MKPSQIVMCVIAVGALALACVELAHLMDTGTCASGGPYVSAHPCPAGTGARIGLLVGAIFVYVIALIFSGQGMFLYGLLFVVLSAVFIRGAVTDDDFAAAGWIVGVVFAVMGIVPLFLAIRGWFSHDDEQARERPGGLAAYTQVAMAPAPAASLAVPAPVMATAASDDHLDRLEQLADLHARGVLTDAEFAAEKARILRGGRRRGRS